MSSVERAQAINTLQSLRGRPLIAYATSPRQGLPTAVAPDILPIFYEHLRRLAKHAGALDVFIMTFGGDTTVPLPLQYLMREYADEISALVPAECYSAGTMIALGANEIVMTPLGHLSPVDPSVAHPLNPQSPVLLPGGTPGVPQVLQIAVEQVFSYLSLATEKANLDDQDALTKVFERLAESVHPIALGEIHRSHSLIRVLVDKLLRLHLDDQERIRAIVEALTEKLFNHSYKISRREARDDLNLPVVTPSNDIERAMMDLRDVYVADAKMFEPFDLAAELARAVPVPVPTAGLRTGGAAPTTPTGGTVRLSFEAGFVDSSAGDTAFVFRYEAAPSGNAAAPYNFRQTSKWESTWN